MSGATIGGFIGGIVGVWTGVGWQAGWIVGSAIGGYVDPTQVFGPRLSDLRGQTSNVGGAIPRAWGTAPVPGNVIWQQPGVTEHENTDDGKGSGTEQVTYSYTRSYAIMFHLGEIAGVLQIKRNGKIVYDARDDATLEEEYTSFGMTLANALERITGQRAANAKFMDRCRIYTGTQTQEPDPTIESYKGVGNASAYRGRAYFVVRDDETQAGEIAQYEVVVASCGTVNNFPGIGTSWVIGYDGSPSVEFSPDGLDWSQSGISPSPAWSPNAMAYAATNEDSVLLTTPAPTSGTNACVFSDDRGATWSASTGLSIASSGGECLYAGGYWHVSDAFHGAQRSADGIAFSAVGTSPGIYTITVHGDSLYGLGSSRNIYKTTTLSGDVWEADSPANFSSAASPASFRMHASPDELGAVGLEVASFGGGGADDVRCHIHSKSEGVWTEHPNPFPDQLDTSAQTPCIRYSSELGLWVVIFYNRVAYGTSLAALTLSPHVFSELPINLDSDNTKFVTCGLNGLLEWTDNGNDWEALSPGVSVNILAIASFWGGGSTAIPDAPGWYINSDGSLSGPAYSTLTPCGTTTDGEIVAAMCELSGLTPDEYDVSQLTTTLDGYVVARETDAASVIESLRPIGMFDPAEWDGKFRGIKRGGTAVASINGDDLVARDGDPFERELAQEAEFLRKVTVGYLDTQAAWSPNTQTWERRVGTIDARGESVVEVTAVMGANQAATTAKRKGFVSWGEPEKQKLSLAYRHAALTPTDVVNYTDDDSEVSAIRLMQIEDDAGIREIESSTNCAEAYNTTATGVAPKPPTVTEAGTPRGPTSAVYMNLPSLRTQDNVPGVYIAAYGLMSGWTGAEILLSADGGVSYQRVARFSTPSTMGQLTASCTASSEPISVQMESGALESITDTQLAARQNAFAITTNAVSEVGQFQTATAGGDGAYDLTENVRGFLGTTAASHVNGDPFVMVSTAQFVPLDISLAGRTLYFKSVTFGTSPDAAEAVPFVFSPLFTSVVVEAYTDDAGNVYTDDAGNTYYYEGSIL